MISADTAKMTVYLPRRVLEAVKFQAAAQQRTVSNYVAHILAEACNVRAVPYPRTPLSAGLATPQPGVG